MPSDRARAALERHLETLALPAHVHDPHALEVVRAVGGDPGPMLAVADLWAEVEALARSVNEDANLPRLERWDGLGRRIETIRFHPDTRALGRIHWSSGVLERTRAPGQELTNMAALYVLAQAGESGHACPMACTSGLIKVLRAAPDAHAAWLEGLATSDYDRALRGAQFLTEIQGGSDVGANALRAESSGDTWRLFGEKWFCSVADADLFLVTARPAGAPDGTAGLQAFVVPRTVEGRPNGFSLRRLKTKLGTRAMASAEIDFDGAVAVPVADFGTTVGVVLTTSRVYNTVCSAGFMQRAWREAWSFAQHRSAFGAPLASYPSIRSILARLQLRACSARALALLVAHWTDLVETGGADADLRARHRALVMLGKLWTSQEATQSVRDAMEVLGGNGVIDDMTALPRLLRDALVMEAWEGGHNVLALQVAKDARRAGTVEPLFSWIEGHLGPSDPETRGVRRAWESAVRDPDSARMAERARLLCQALAGPVYRAALAEVHRGQAPSPLAASVRDELARRAQPGWSALGDIELSAREALLVPSLDPGMV